MASGPSAALGVACHLRIFRAALGMFSSLVAVAKLPGEWAGGAAGVCVLGEARLPPLDHDQPGAED